MAKRGKTQKTPEQKIINKLAKKLDLPCLCTHELVAHLIIPSKGCSLCVGSCTMYRPSMSIEIVTES